MNDQEIYAKAQKIYIYLWILKVFMLNNLFVVEYGCFKPGITREYVMLLVNLFFFFLQSCVSCVTIW